MSGLEHSRVAAVVDRLKVKDKQYESAMSYIGHVVAFDDEAIQEARLEELEALTESKRRLPILIWALCVIAFTLLTLGIFQLEQNRQYLSSYGVASTSFEPAQMRKASEKYSAEERMVLDGDIQYNGHLDRVYHRWQADRENNIYYIDYCQTYEETTYTYPTDMIEVGASIDPHNAWYYLASLSTMNLRDDSVLKRIRNGSNYSDPATPACRFEVWEVNNRTEVDKAYEYLKQSYARKNLTDRAYELTQKKLDIITNGREFDMITMMEPMTVSATTRSSAVKYLLVHDLLSAKFYELSQNKTDVSKEEVQCWIAFYKDFLRKSSTQTTLLDQMVIIAGMRGVASNMLEAAKTAELEDEAAKISELITQLNADKYLMDTRGPEFDNGAFERKTSVLADLVVPMVGSKSIEIIELDLALLTPSRMAEHSFAGRILAGFAVCLIGFILIIASINYGLRPSAARKLSSRMLARLSAVDWLLILGVGVIFPVLFYLWFISSSQWSAREFGLGYETPGAMFLVQFSAMIFMIVILSSNLLRWRLHQQNSHIVAKPSRFSWVVSISIILLLPAAYYLADYPAVSTIIIGIILSLVFISVLGGLGRFCFSSKHKLAKSSVNLGFLATLSTLIILLQVLAMYHHREEVKWIMQDEFLVTAKGLPEFTSYEAEVAEQMKKENMERIKLLD